MKLCGMYSPWPAFRGTHPANSSGGIPKPRPWPAGHNVPHYRSRAEHTRGEAGVESCSAVVPASSTAYGLLRTEHSVLLLWYGMVCNPYVHARGFFICRMAQRSKYKQRRSSRSAAQLALTFILLLACCALQPGRLFRPNPYDSLVPCSRINIDTSDFSS